MTSFKKRLLSALFLATLVSAPAYAGEIKQTMKQMNQAFRGAMSSSSTAEMAPYVAALKASGTAASRLSLSGTAEEQTTYRQGMQQLQNAFSELDRAIASGNLDNAKAILQQIKNTQKTYHSKLGV